MIRPMVSTDLDESPAERMFREATSLEDQGQLLEAEALYRNILRAEPGHALCLVRLGLACAAFERFEEAISCYDQALATNPDQADVHSYLGNAHYVCGRAEQAIAHYEKALALDPDRADACHGLGDALNSLQRPKDAVACYERALAINPRLAKTHNNLANMLFALGHHRQAIAHYESAISIDPDAANAHYNLGIILAALGRLEEGIAHFEQAVTIAPGFANAHRNLADRLMALNRDDEAVVHYEKALAIRPDFAEARSNLANVLQKLGRLKEAIVEYERALADRPDYPQIHYNLANGLHALGRFDEAIARYQMLLTIKPDHAEAHNNMGLTLLALGRLEEAGRAFERAVEIAPRKVDSLRNLAGSRPFTAGDPRLPALEALQNDEESLTDDEQAMLHFALGKAYGDLHQHERSFHHLLKANSLKRRHVAYDEAATLRLLEGIQTVFTRDLMLEKRGAGDPSPVPVFVVGMPRSGTTLIEQILASHSGIVAAGELDDFSKLTSALRARNNDQIVFPDVVSAMAGEEFHELGFRYLSSIRAIAPTAQRIVDKMPSNFSRIGLINLALPNARIIHVHRDPLDTCLSCFSILFMGDQPFSYDLAELGHFYHAYQLLMEHWRSVLPEGVMIDVQYEDVVDDLERQARRIIAHCDLDWEDSCIAFHETERPVQTASARQVRQPIYRSSVGRWQPYADLLQPLLSALQINLPDRS